MRQERFCAARDRLRAEGDVAVAGWPARADWPGGGRSAAAEGAPDRAAGIAGGERAALCLAQAAAPAELRGTGLSSRGFGLVSCLCPPAVGVDVAARVSDKRV